MGPLDLAPLRRDISARDSGVVILLGIWILTSAFPIPVEHGGGLGGGIRGLGKPPVTDWEIWRKSLFWRRVNGSPGVPGNGG